MRQERRKFLDRLAAIQAACDEPLLVNTADVAHNERAKQLRCGLCVMTFSALEDFLRERISQVVDHIAPAIVPFSSLPSSFQNAATAVAIQSISFQSQFQKEDTRLKFIIDELIKLGKISDPHYAISRYSFAHSKTNVQLTELENVLLALNVEKPFETIFRTAQRLQLGTTTSIKTQFEELSDSRHSAAHNQNFNITNGDLKSRVSSTFSVGIAFDIVLSCSALNINASFGNNHGKLSPLKASDINIYTIPAKAVAGKYLLYREGQRRVIQKDPALNIVRAAGIAKLATEIGVVVLQDAKSMPFEWYCRSAGD